jgi:hypothetical protein
MDTQELLNERDQQYGDTWLLAGQVMGVLRKPYYHLLETSPAVSHNWVLMLSKLIRILFSPNNEDHYEDLIGYATLCLNYIRKENGNDISTSKST